MTRIQAKELVQLKELSRQARIVIAKTFADYPVHPNNNRGLIGWGQYLDLRRKQLSEQFGIYGTSAGLQILSMHNPNLYSELIDGARLILPLVTPQPPDAADDIHDYFRRKGDLQVTYKVAALADAYRPELETVNDTIPVAETLADLRSQGGGWGYFRRPDLDEFEHPNVHATATALLALGRFSTFRESAACSEALDWLADNVDTSALSISTLAIIIMALQLVSGVDEQRMNIRQLRDKCERVVVDWAHRSVPEDTKRIVEATEYMLPKPHADAPLQNIEQEFIFMIYLPHCLAALALAKSKTFNDGRTRRYVISVARSIATEICTTGAFVAAGRNLMSSVEHLWFYRFLKEFEVYEPYETRGDVVKDWIQRSFHPRRLSTTLAIVLIIFAISNRFAPAAVTLLLLPIAISFVINIASNMVYDDIFHRT
jgi:hypothetical protein